MKYKYLKNNQDIFKENSLGDAYISAKYQIMLNNLLSIKTRSDGAVFTKLTTMNKDLTRILGEKEINEIFTNNEFRIRLKKQDTNEIITTLEKVKTIEELTDFIESNKILVKNSFIRKMQKANTRPKIRELIKELSKKIQAESSSFLTRWKRYQKEINDAFDQTNMWPLFVGTYFIKTQIDSKSIYAPLLLKKVEIDIIDKEVCLASKSSSIIFNDKLVFYLDQQKNEFPIINDEVDYINFADISRELDVYFKNIVQKQGGMLEEFNELKVDDVTNSNLIRTPGIVLLFAQPSGSALRQITIDLIKNGKMDKLVNVEANSYADRNVMLKELIETRRPIARVCQTDASQEKAILAALNHSSIIIGPPGTGKSQTIANILANIMNENKSALFISQKRIALEVVLERMKELKHYTLQLVEHKTKSSISEKQEFYNYIRTFLQKIQNKSEFESKNVFYPLITDKQEKYWNSKVLNNRIPKNEFDLFCLVKREIPKIDVKMLNDLHKLFNEFRRTNKLSEVEKISELHEYNIKQLAKKLNVEPKKILGIFNKYGKEFRQFHKNNIKLLNIIDQYNVNQKVISVLVRNSNPISLSNLNKIYKYHSSTIPNLKPFISDEKNIENTLVSRIKKIYDEIKKNDASWEKRFTGRIEREITQPSKFISLFKKELKQLFNVVVSTPETLSMLVDFEKDRYDYIIFDEASQIFLEKAIPYISIGKKIIIAGDNQQMKPSNWFDKRYKIEDSDNPKTFDEDEYDDVFMRNKGSEMDSLLNYAIDRRVPRYTLELNYRSVAASLTSFSSKEFYESNLKTLDKNVEINAPIEVVNVNGTWEDSTNEKEALFMIKCLKKNVDKYNRIILLTLNTQQMQLVDMLLSKKEPQLYMKVIEGDIILKNLENIQGDEADLVIMSIAYTSKTMLASTYVCHDGGRNALNVAITRAKSKMIILKSIHSSDIRITNKNNENLITFKNWIEFLEMNEMEQKTYSMINNGSYYDYNNTDSFELEIYQWLLDLKFYKEIVIKIKYPIGSYVIDLAILDAKTNKFLLGLEIESFYHLPNQAQKYNDLLRESFIENKGYKLLRIPELLWKTNKEKVHELIKTYVN